MPLFWRRATTRSAPRTPDAPQRHGDLRDLVRTAGALGDLSEGELDAFVEHSSIRKLSAGQRLLEIGQRLDGACLVLSGCVQFKEGAGTCVEELVAGDWIGDIEPGSTQVSDMSAVARSSTLLLELAPAALLELSGGLVRAVRSEIRRSALARVARLRVRVGQLSRRQDDFAAVLFELRSRSNAGFAQSLAVRQLFSKVNALPLSSLQLLHKMLDERTTKAEIVDLVSTDPSLTSTLLRAANTPLFGLRQKITNVGHAIVLMGHDIVYQIIMSESMRQTLPKTPFFAEVHRRTVELSRIAHILSETLGAGRPAEVATLGILADVGLVVTELLKTYNPRLSPLFEGLAPAEMGAELLRSWGLPDLLCKSIEYAQHPEIAPPHRVPVDVRANVAALYLARCCHQDLYECRPPLPRLFVLDYLAAVGYPGLTVESLLRDRLVPRLRAQSRHLPRAMAQRVMRLH